MNLRVALVVNFPADLYDRYAPFARRWAETYAKFPAEYPHEVIVAVSGMTDDDRWAGLFPHMHFHRAQTGGCDIGAYLSFSRSERAKEFDFMVCCGATVYFHKSSWLKVFMQSREQHGPGLYTASASLEGHVPGHGSNPAPNPHARTSFFGCDPKMLAAYPWDVQDRADCYRFEGGDRKFGLLCRPVRMVCWSGVYSLADCRKPENVFRKGNQSALICHDGRTDEYAKAAPEEKKRLENLANGYVI